MNLEVGQIWSYETRNHERNSTVTIFKIEKNEGRREIIHVWVEGLLMNNPECPAKPLNVISHMPFSRDAIESCLIELVETVDIHDYNEGYETWRKGYLKGNAGIFTVSVKEAVVLIEDTWNTGDDAN